MLLSEAYKILGATPATTTDGVRSAWRNLALVNHPDENPNDTLAHGRMVEINNAYDVAMAAVSTPKPPLFGPSSFTNSWT